MRRVLLPLVLFMALSASAQVTKKFMGEIVREFEKNQTYISGVTGAPSNEDTTHLVPQYDRFIAMASSVYEDADLVQKKALLYYATILEFRMGYMYAEAGYWTAAYERFYKYAEEGMKYIIEPKWFPVIFETDSFKYTLDRNYISQIEFVFYTDLLRSALNSKKWQEATEIYATIKRNSRTPEFHKYMASGAMIAFVINRKKTEEMSDVEKNDLVEFYARHISSLGQLDAAAKQKLGENNNPGYATRYNNLYKAVMELLPQTDPKWRTPNYENIGLAYYDARDTTKARDLLMIALSNNNGPMESATLGIAADVAIATGDKEMGLKVIENLKEYHSDDPNDLHKIASIYMDLLHDKRSAKEYIRKAGRARKN